jgi:hypothetical protein
MAVQVQLRRGTSAEWASVNPIIAQGEFVIELDSGRFKLGNGVDRWNNLPYNGFVGHGSDPSNWNTNIKLGLYDVNRLSWSGTLGSPTDAIPIGLLAVFVSGFNVVQRYQPSNDSLITVEYVRTKIGNDDWSPWSQASDGARLDGGTF